MVHLARTDIFIHIYTPRKFDFLDFNILYFLTNDKESLLDQTLIRVL